MHTESGLAVHGEMAPPKKADARRGYRWIAREIDSLDPETDYVRIWQLTSCYRVDETAFNLLYCLGLPRITQNPAGSELLASRTRKAVDQMHKRAYDTLSSFWTWYEKGPASEETQRSIELVNRIHAGLAKKWPEAFPDEDYVYTVCMLATSAHQLRQKIGVAGFSNKQKIAAHHFWRDILRMMRGINGYIDVFPDDFAGMEKLVAEFDARDWPHSEAGCQLAEYTVQQFCEANFPRPLHGLGRQMVLTMQEPYIRKLRDMGEPNPLAAFLVRKLMHFKIWMAEHVLPDPKLSVPERARRAGRTDNQMQIPPMIAVSEVPFARDGRLGPAPPRLRPKAPGNALFTDAGNCSA
ncbi:hypothetical protein [Rhizobium alvei]|uniref:ER-bound oxygenase mpaB/mpaB'/Rubber oxygenase catalytic domain-containing protein n=1 Tax=Rhizobium alvei TaxID=1132659 RepID=A0ABT8YRB3_9HYPH|nr:hypothetical protein [Rhizobium alvei]MDO6966152.1 hypothetical protein [Rhizobium alvei]